MYKLMQLPYSTDALEPYIDQLTVETHYGKHHGGYVAKLNGILEGNEELLNMDIAELLVNLSKVEESKRQAVFNNGGQIYNHNVYWESMSPNGGGEPTGKLLEAINKTFGSFENLKKELSEAGATQFGSGWAWLSVNQAKELVVTKTSNAESPLMHSMSPIMTIDVWEHAYYLKYKNLRPDYIEAFFGVANWEGIGAKYDAVVS